MADKQVDVVYVVPPVLSIGTPVFGVSLLSACLHEEGISCCIDYANAYFADAANGELDAITTLELFHPLLEYLFNKPAGIDNGVSVEEAIEAHVRVRCLDYPHEAAKYRSAEYRKTVRAAANKGLEIAETETERTARRVLSMNPKVVGCSATFTQRNAALAILKRIKELAPSVTTVLGGYHASGDSGLAIMRCFKFVDCVFFGESDDIVAEAIDKIMSGQTDNMPYGVVMNSDSLPLKAPLRIVEDLDAIPTPDFDDYFKIVRSPMGQKLVGEKNKAWIHCAAEASRGCWWGEKSPCRFCGVCGKTRQYRTKSPERVAEQLCQLKERYGTNIIDFTDAIMPLSSSDQIIEAIRATGEEFLLYTEVKSNISKDRINNLADVGYVSLQPGIESLSDSFLKLINKGVSAVQNVAFIKNATQRMRLVVWNILCGAPGETDEQYLEQIELLPKLMHLSAPGGVSSIWYFRDSSYYDHQKDYGLDLVPMDEYKVFCPAEEDFIGDTAVYFRDKNAEPATDERERLRLELRNQCAEWMRLHAAKRTRLDMSDSGDILSIADSRKCRTKFLHKLEGVSREVYLLADQPISKSNLVESLSSKYDIKDIDEALEYLIGSNLMIFLSNCYLSLALPMDEGAFMRKYLLPLAAKGK